MDQNMSHIFLFFTHLHFHCESSDVIATIHLPQIQIYHHQMHSVNFHLLFHNFYEYLFQNQMYLEHLIPNYIKELFSSLSLCYQFKSFQIKFIMGLYAMLILSHADLNFIKPQIYVIEYLLPII